MNAPDAAAVSDYLAIANRFFKAIEDADMDTVAAIYATDAVVWHNYDPLNRRFETGNGSVVRENIALLAAVQRFIIGMKYEVWFHESTESGFVRQHIISGSTIDGSPVRFPACIIAVVKSGRIAALHEYLDISHLPVALLRHFAALAAADGT